MITHIVLFWTDKPQGENRDQLLAAARKLESIPGVQNFRCGTAMSSPRGAVDDSFAVAISMDLENADALKAYATHPEHLHFIENALKPLASRFVVYDIES